MPNQSNPLSEATPWNQVAQGYAEVTMKMFQGYADKALELAKLAAHDHILDIACGPGTLALTAAPKVKSVQAIDFSAPMLDILNESIRRQGITNIDTHHGDAQALPYSDASFDAAFSMFGLMFFPDRVKAYREIHRTLKPGGSVVISSWAPVAQSPTMLAVFGALRAINPALPEPQTDIASLENPDFFRDELTNAGFNKIELHLVTQHWQFQSVEQFWNDMVIGSAPLVMLKRSLSDEAWQEKSQIALRYLNQTINLATPLSADAWIAVGRKPS